MKQNYSIVDLFDEIFKDVDMIPNEVFHSKIFDFNYPPMNFWINEESKDLEIELAIAGIPKEDVDLSFEGDYLLINIKNSFKEKEGFKLIQRGIRRSECKNRVYIPASKYDATKATAAFNDGILKVIIPAKEEMKPRKLLIE